MTADRKDQDDAERNSRIAMRMIRKEIKRLLDQWDPLSLRGLHGFGTEYDPYVGPIGVLVRKGAEPMEIARHLDRLVREEWGLPPCREKCVQVAEKIHRCGNMLR